VPALIGAALTLWLLHLLGPALSPFLLAAILAYICSPGVDWLARRRVPRPAGSVLVLALLGLGLAGLALILLPLVQEQISRIADKLPPALSRLEAVAGPWLSTTLGIDIRLDTAQLTDLAREHQDSLKKLLTNVVGTVSKNGLMLIGVLASLLLVPIVMFYLMSDWPTLLGKIDALVPRRWHQRVITIAGEIDAVLGQFLRGQVSVMLLLALYYSLGLWLAGVEFALPVGILTGLLIIIPYAGFGLGLILAALTAFMQGAGWPPLIGVAIVYGIGQVLESFVLTPYIVGDRIGLHPLAVIFALVAFGQLFGFFGILLALPASAALLVGLRHLRAAYLASNLYRGS
jgi:predicted PurR-regulated permease PerM